MHAAVDCDTMTSPLTTIGGAKQVVSFAPKAPPTPAISENSDLCVNGTPAARRMRITEPARPFIGQ